MKKADDFAAKASGATKVPLHDKMAAEFRNHKAAISAIRDAVDNGISNMSPPETIQIDLDSAKAALESLNIGALGFDACYKVHYQTSKDKK